MDTVATLGLVIACCLALYVGSRLLLLWWRTRMFPELLHGISILSIASGSLLLTYLGGLSL